MPIKLVDHTRSPSYISDLEVLEFSNLDEGKYFTLSDSKENEIRVDYIPPFVSTWDPERYEIVLLENPYLTAENDIFEIYESTIEGRLGWVCPIAALDSNDNDYVDDKSFKNYRYVAYWKLLKLEFEINYQEGKRDYHLSEIFPNLFVFIISKEEIVKISGFKIENYALSLLKFEYLIFKNNIKGKKVFNKEDFINTLRRDKHSLRIKKSSFDISTNQYTKSLFLEHLYQSENFLVKYILLYQILEQFMEEKADKLLDELIQSYQSKKISKNSLREKLGRTSADRVLLKKVFEKSTINKDLKMSFVEKCIFLFTDVNEEVGENFEDVLYDLRNLITHRYRTIADKTDDLKGIISLFETLMIELLINLDATTTTISEEEVSTKRQKAKNIKEANVEQPKRDIFVLQLSRIGISLFLIEKK